MSESRGRATLIALLMLISLLVFIPTATPAGTNITVDERWSDDRTLSDNVTVAIGATLTIDTGANITVSGDHRIDVYGALIISGGSNSSVVLWSNATPIGGGGATGLWEGITIMNGATIQADNVIVRGARAAFDVFGTGTLSDVTVEDSYMGARARGSLNLNGFTCSRIDFTCLEVTGSATADGIDVDNSGTAVDHIGNLDLDDLHVESGAIGLQLAAGATGSADTLSFDSISTSVISRGVSNMVVDGVQANSVGLLLDSVDSDGFTLSDVSGFDVDVVLIGSNIIDLTLKDIEVTGSGAEGWALDIRNSGSFKLLDGNLSGFTDSVQISGTGATTLQDLDLHASNSLISASGISTPTSNGLLNVVNGTWTSDGVFGHLSGIDSSWSSTILTGSGSEHGLDIVGGTHWLDATTLSRDYQFSDQTSFGIKLLWGQLVGFDLTLSGWSDGLQCLRGCTVNSPSLTAGLGGVSSGSGVLIDGGGAVEIDSLSTQNSYSGVHLVEGTLHVENWVASSHQSAVLQVDDDGSAVVRNLPSFGSNSLWDAIGGGSLLWGSSGQARVSVSSAEEFTESTVTVTDLAANPLSDIIVEAHGFQETTNSNGEADVPLLQSGSLVSATDTSTGVTDTLQPPSGILQLPILPANGDWTIPIGVDALLIDDIFTINGDLIIEAAATLTLRNATLNANSMMVQGSGQLIGEGGILNSGSIALDTPNAITGIDTGLSLTGPLDFTCSQHTIWQGVHLSDVTLSSDCSVTIDGGSVSGAASVQVDNWLAIRNAALVRVLDWGEPVQGVTVTIQGNQEVTNSEGIALFTATSRNITETTDDSTGVLPVYVIRGSHSQINSWDTSESTAMDVMLSTISAGLSGDWLRLPSTFSPYYLEGNLTVSEGDVMTLYEHVSLTVGADRGIHIEGLLEANLATISGADWNGVQVSNGGQADLNNGQFIGAPLIVGSGGLVSLESMILDSAELHLNSGGTAEVENGLLYQSDNCIWATGGTLTMSGTTLQSCSQNAATLTQVEMAIDDITLGASNHRGLYVRGGSGTISNVDATAHDGQSSALFLEMVDEALSISDVALASGGSSAALQIEWSEFAEISGGSISGAPALSIRHSTVMVNGLDFTGSGDGVAIEIEGVRAERTQISDCTVTNYDTAVVLTGDDGDLENDAPLFVGNEYHTNTTYEALGLGFESHGEIIDGEIVVGGSKQYIAEIWNPEQFDSTQININGPVELVIGSTWTVTVMGDSVEVLDSAELTVTVETFSGSVQEQTISTTTNGGNTSIPLIYQAFTETGQQVAVSALWSASSSGYITGSGAFSIAEESNRDVTVSIATNQPPTITITEPSGPITVQEGQSVNFSSLTFDPDFLIGQEHNFIWYIREQGDNPPGSQFLTNSAGSVESIGSVGVYIITVEVTDPWGSTAQDSTTITVILDDADGDYIPSCAISGENKWYDLVEDRYCGPDIFDEDDDNDRIGDIRDAFPFDACAHSDTDFDGMPDSLLPNCQTDLLEDDDDDNDGTPDSQDPNPVDATITGTPESSTGFSLLSPEIILPLLLIVVVVVFIFVRGSRDELGGTP